MPLEEAVRKMTSLPAATFGIEDRGTIRPGLYADMVLFDPDTIRDTGTYTDPVRYPEGITMVWVNGEPVVDESRQNAGLPGRVLRR